MQKLPGVNFKIKSKLFALLAALSVTEEGDNFSKKTNKGHFYQRSDSST